MQTKTVYSFDPNTRAFLGAIILSEADGDMSPLEPGVWHIPGSCLEVAPPERVEVGKYAAAGETGWEIRDLPMTASPKDIKATAKLHAAVRAFLDSQPLLWTAVAGQRQMQAPRDALLTEMQAAAHLNIAPATLAAWRATKRASQPRYCRIGGAIRYRASDIHAFITESVQGASA